MLRKTRLGTLDRFATPRLTATRLSRQDLPDLVALHLDPQVSRFIGGVRTAASTKDYLERNLRHWDDHGFGLWTLRTHEGAFAGRAGLRWIEVDGAAELEIAYTFATIHWGRGLASEVAAALVDIWNEGGFGDGLVGVVTKGHDASERVLIKTGFVFERETVCDGEPCSIFRRTRQAPALTRATTRRRGPASPHCAPAASQTPGRSGRRR